MANVLITPTVAGFNAAGADDPVAATLAAATDDVGYLTHAASVAAHLPKDQVELSRIVLRLSGTGTSVTVLAGENPPSNRKIVGNKLIAVDGVTYVTLEAANYTWNDGTVRLQNLGAADVTVLAIQMPKTA